MLGRCVQPRIRALPHRGAVATCAQFESIIETSKWAEPVRDALKGSLALPTLTGKLAAKNLSGLKDALPGSTVFGPAPGVFGANVVSVTSGGKTTRFTITAEPGGVEYHLVPASGDEDFRSMPSECEA